MRRAKKGRASKPAHTAASDTAPLPHAHRHFSRPRPLPPAPETNPAAALPGSSIFPAPPPAPRPRCPKASRCHFWAPPSKPEDRGTAPTARQTARPGPFPRHKVSRRSKVLPPCPALPPPSRALPCALHRQAPASGTPVLRSARLYTQTRTDQADSRHLAARRQRAWIEAAAPQAQSGCPPDKR